MRSLILLDIFSCWHRCVQHKITAFRDGNLWYKVTSIFMKVDRKAVQRHISEMRSVPFARMWKMENLIFSVTLQLSS